MKAAPSVPLPLTFASDGAPPSGRGGAIEFLSFSSNTRSKKKRNEGRGTCGPQPLLIHSFPQGKTQQPSILMRKSLELYVSSQGMKNKEEETFMPATPQHYPRYLLSWSPAGLKMLRLLLKFVCFRSEATNSSSFLVVPKSLLPLYLPLHIPTLPRDWTALQFGRTVPGLQHVEAHSSF